MKSVKFFQIVILAFLLNVGFMHSSGRNYAWTYEYYTLPAGDLALEIYLSAKVPSSSEPGTNDFYQKIEAGFGISKNTDLALGVSALLENGPVSGYNYDGFELWLRHGVSKKNVLPVDILFCLGYERSSDLSKTDVVVWKEVFTKDIDRLNISYNMSFDYQPKNNWRFEHGFAFGVNYEFIDALRIGIEANGNYSNKKYYLGPSISLNTSDLNIILGPKWGMNDNSDYFEVGMAFGITFR